MAFVTVEGGGDGSGAVSAPAPAPKAMGKPAGVALVPAPPSPEVPFDEGYLYQTYSPAAGGASTSTGPQGGVINYANGADPNGYYWVDDGTPGGYYYRPEDGAIWRNTPVEQVRSGVQGIVGGFANPTNPAVIKQDTGPGFKAVLPGDDQSLLGIDQAFSSAAAAGPQYSPVDMAALDLGFSNRQAVLDRGNPELNRLNEWVNYINGMTPEQFDAWQWTEEGQRILGELQAAQGRDFSIEDPGIAEGAIPRPFIPGPSALAMPLPVIQQMGSAVRPRIYTAEDFARGDIPRGEYYFSEGRPGAEVVSLYRDGKFIRQAPELSAAIFQNPASLSEIATMAVTSPFAEDINRLPVPGFLKDTLKTSTSPLGLATLGLPVAGVSSVGGRIAANLAQDAIFGLASVGAEKAGVPKPYTYLLGLTAAVGGEAALGRALTRGVTKEAVNVAASGARVPPVTRVAPEIAPEVDELTPLARMFRPVEPEAPVARIARPTPAAVDNAAEAAARQAALAEAQKIVQQFVDPAAPIDKTVIVMLSRFTPEERAVLLKNIPAEDPQGGSMYLTIGSTGSKEKLFKTPNGDQVSQIRWDRTVDDATQTAVRQATPPSVSFTTANGSTYTIQPDGTTIRNKAPRPEHPGDSGIKEVSEATIYVDPTTASLVNPGGLTASTGQPANWRLIVNPDGTISLAVKNPDGKWGISPESLNLPASTTPELGKSPIELWQRDPDPFFKRAGVTAYRKIHVGNKITSVRQAGESTAGQAAEAAARQAAPPLAARVAESAARAVQVDATNQAAAARLVDALRPIDPAMAIDEIVQKELSITTKVKNLVMSAAHQGQRSEAMDAIARVQSAMKPRIEAVATVQSEHLWRNIESAFNFNKNNVIRGLRTAPEGITLQDLAAQLPRHWNGLTETQQRVMRELQQWSTSQGDAFRLAGRDFGTRPDIMEGGFYLPRGNALKDDMDDAVRHINYGSPRGGFPQLRAARMETMASAIGKGYRYISPKEALRNLSVASNQARLQAAFGDFVKSAVDDMGNPIARADSSMTAPLGWTIPKMGELRGYHLATEFAREWDEYFQSLGPAVGRGTWPLRAYDAMTQLLRYMAATGDASWTMITGSALASVDPVGYGRALVNMVQAGASKRTYAAVLETIDQRARSLTHVEALLGRPLTVEYLASRGVGLFGGGAHEFSLPGGVLGNIGRVPGYQAAERAFMTASDSGRLHATLSHIDWRFKGRHAPKTREEAIKVIDEVIKAVNPISGAAGWHVGGSLGQRAFFASRWLASQIEFVGKGMIGTPGYVLKIGTGGVVNLNPIGVDIAAKHLTHMIAAGTAMTVGINMMNNAIAGRDLMDGMMGKDFWSPFTSRDGKVSFNSNFMRFRVGGDDYSIFGPWDSLARAAGTMAMAVRYQDPEMLAQVYRSKASPLISLIWSLAEGKDYIGKKTHSLEWLGEQMLPFSWRNGAPGDVAHEIFFEHDPGGAMRAMARMSGQVIGLKSSPITPWEAFDEDLRRHEAELSEYLYPNADRVSWSNLTPAGKDVARRLGLVPPSEREGGLSKYQEAKKDAEAKLQIDLQYAHDEYKAGRKNLDWVKSKLEIAEHDYYQALQAASEPFNEYKSSGQFSKDPFRRAEQEYYALFDKHRLPNGDVDVNAVFAELEELKKGWTPAQREFFEKQVEPSIGSDRKYPETIQGLKDAKTKVYESGFYDAENKPQFLRDNPEVAELVEKYQLSPYQSELRKKQDELMARQAGADKVLIDALTKNPQDVNAGKNWRDTYSANLKELRDWKEGAGSQQPDFTDDERDPQLSAYFEFLESHKYLDDLYREQTDWAAVDAYVASTPGLQEKLDSYSGFVLTPVAEVKRAEQKMVEESGYFGIRTMAWESFATDEGVGGYSDYYDWKNEHYSAVTGWDSKENEELNKKFSSNYLNAAEVAWIKENPSAAYYAIKWGYYTPSSKAEKEAAGWPTGGSSSGSSSGGLSKTEQEKAEREAAKAAGIAADQAAYEAAKKK